MLPEALLERLKKGKNLLAFSGGGDSTALFFLLHEAGIAFDIALVNYKTRQESDAEEAYAKDLAYRFTKECHTLTCKLPEINFEHEARQQRYAFFESLIQQKGYTTLLTAHHLGDQLEWLLMQLCKGSGLIEMLGMQTWEKREGYTLCRPLLTISKTRLLSYLHAHNHAYFEDSSNAHTHTLRNHFRHHHALPLLERFEAGIARSFTYLAEDAKRLRGDAPKRFGDLFVYPKSEDPLFNIRRIDHACKRLGVVLSHKQRTLLLAHKDGVVSGKIAIGFGKDRIMIAPWLHVSMDKKFKELCRQEKIPPHIRPYLFTLGISAEQLRSCHTL